MPRLDTVDEPTPATSFALAVQDYERGRPPYPEPALDWLLPPGATDAVDVGAGTGKLTRQLVARGLRVTAVEPLPEMLAELHRTVPGAVARAGRAEQTGLDSQSVDAVLAAQAWHWVDVPAAAAEAARVLRAGGRLGVLWNLRDEREPWVAELGRLIVGAEHDVEHLDPIAGAAQFGPVSRAEFAWTHHLDRAELQAMVASRSNVILRPAAQRAALLESVAKLTLTHPDLRDQETFELPYRTLCLRADRH